LSFKKPLYSSLNNVHLPPPSIYSIEMTNPAIFNLADCSNWLDVDVDSNALLDQFLDPALDPCYSLQTANSIDFRDLGPELLPFDMTLDNVDAAAAVPDLFAASPVSDAISSPQSTLAPSSPADSSDDESVSRPRPRRSARPGARGPRLPHNAVEKNYRNSLNAALQRLQRVVPRVATPAAGDMDSDDGLEFAVRPPTKAAILHAAVDYIQQLEQERANAQEADALHAAMRRSELLLDKVALKDAVAGVLAERRRSGQLLVL
jgi:Helix-loop-helix DNA-binding domain